MTKDPKSKLKHVPKVKILDTLEVVNDEDTPIFDIGSSCYGGEFLLSLYSNKGTLFLFLPWNKLITFLKLRLVFPFRR